MRAHRHAVRLALPAPHWDDELFSVHQLVEIFRPAVPNPGRDHGLNGDQLLRSGYQRLKVIDVDCAHLAVGLPSVRQLGLD